MSKTRTLLISFRSSIGVQLDDGHIVMCYAVICEEVFKGAVEITPRVDKNDNPIGEVKALVEDFPLYVKVISLGDNRKLKRNNTMIVKWSNISAIGELDEESM